MRRPRGARRNLNAAIFALRGSRGAEWGRGPGRAGEGRRLWEPNAGRGERERRDGGSRGRREGEGLGPDVR